MRPTILFVFLSITLSVFAQKKTIESYINNPHFLRWEDGPLTWDIIPAQDSARSYVQTEDFMWEMLYYRTKEKKRDTLFRFMDFESFLIHPRKPVLEGQTEGLLQFYQVLLNIMEIHERRGEKETRQLVNRYTTIEREFDSIEEDISNAQWTFQDDIAGLRDIEALTDRILENQAIPDLQLSKRSDFAIGGMIGATHLLYSGLPREHFRNSYGANFGLTVGWRRILFLAQADILSPNMISPPSSDERWTDPDYSIRTSLARIGLSYLAINSKNWRVGLYTGYGSNQFSALEFDPESEDEDLIESMRGLNMGLVIDYKLRKSLEFSPSRNHVGFGTETAIRSQVTYGTMSSAFFGRMDQLSFSIGLIWESWMFK